MVATVGSISIDLSTNAAKFAQGFKASASTVEQQSARMSKAVNGFSSASKAASGIVSGFVGGIAAGGALAALSSLSGALSKARQSLSDFDDVLNNSRASGVSAETYQALAFGAAQSDVEQEKLNKSLEIFAKNIGLAQEGTGSLFSSLKILNPELLQAVLTAGDQEERLKLVADAMNQASDATQRAALATAAFGKGGIDLIRILDGGAAGIDAFKEEAKALGLIVTEADLKRWSEADKQLDTLARVIDGNLSQALANLAGPLVAAAEGAATIAKNVNELSTAINNFSDSGSVENFLALLAALGIEPKITGGLLGAIRDGVTRDVPAIKADIASVQQQIADLQEQAAHGIGVGISIDDAKAHLKELEAELSKVAASAAALNSQSGAFGKMLSGLDKLGGGARRPPPTVHGSNLGRTDENGTIRRSTTVPGLDGSPGGTVHTTSFGGSRDAQDFIKSIEENKKATEDGLDDTTDATDDVRQSSDRTGDYVNTANSSINRQGNATNSALHDLGQTFSSVSDAIAALRANGIDPSKATINQSAQFSGGASFGGNTSWAGRRLTFGGGGSSGGSTNPFGISLGDNKLDWHAQQMSGDSVPDSGSIGGSGGESIVVNVVVKPVLEGQRLSQQSRAEIKQAAASGANAALRAYNGR